MTFIIPTTSQVNQPVCVEFQSVKAAGAKGDGVTDDTAALQAVFDEYWGCKIICAYYANPRCLDRVDADSMTSL